MKPAPPVTKTRIVLVSMLCENRSKLANRRQFPVLFRQMRLRCGDGPVNRQRGISPIDPAVVAWHIDLVHFVEDDCPRLKRAEAMGEPARNKQLFTTFAVQF